MAQKKDVFLSGDRPTGPLHIGHYVGSLRSRVELQESCESYVMVADMQALTDYYGEPERVRQSVKEVVLDYLAVGIDPEKANIFIQSKVPAISELTMYYLNLVTWNRLKHNPTVKAELRQKNFGDGVPAGFMTYPVSQAADISAFRATLVPVGEDQSPMLEQTNEIVRTFNRTYSCDVLVPAKGYYTTHGRLPGTDGGAKMSKSLGNTIYLSDPKDVVSKKVKRMYTDPNHLRVEDPGQVEGNPVFTYLDAFGTDLDKITELKEHYQRGGLGDSKVKKYLEEVLQEFLEPIHQRRAKYENDEAAVWGIVEKGTVAANEKAEETLSMARKAMFLDYPF